MPCILSVSLYIKNIYILNSKELEESPYPVFSKRVTSDIHKVNNSKTWIRKLRLKGAKD